tara:strand:- start:3268 stop:3423 length:156 start_codon:yes stop_codon:yes gene_type:complete
MRTRSVRSKRWLTPRNLQVFRFGSDHIIVGTGNPYALDPLQHLIDQRDALR